MNIMPSKYGSYKTVWWERHKKKWSEQEGIWKNIIMDSLVSHGYNHKGLRVNVNDLSIDSSTVSAKGGRGRRRLDTMMVITRRQKEAKYMLPAVVTYISLPIAIDLGPDNEQHESRRLIPLLRNIRIRDRYQKTQE